MSVIDKILKFKNPHRPFCSAVILAAGSSNRMGADKIMMTIGEKPVIAYSLLAFEECEAIDEIVVVTKLNRLQEISDVCHEYGISKVSKVVCGGNTRAESALSGVSQVNEKADIIAIHDGARPFAGAELITKTVQEAKNSLASAPAVKPVDTVRLLNKKGGVASTPDRELVALIQTPQAFNADLIKGALTKAVEKNLPITDDCSAVEAMGVKVSLVEGDPDNIKLTTSRDIYLAEKISADRSAKQ